MPGRLWLRTPSPIPSLREWRAFIFASLLSGGGLLCASGLIFMVAYNWEDLHRLVRLGVAASVLLSVAAATAVQRPHGIGWRVGCLVTALCIGALLALVGQIYQTGADRWQLFATWAATMLPVAALARSRACWALWVVVCSVALHTWQAAHHIAADLWMPPRGADATAMAAVALLCAALWLLVRLWPRAFSTQHPRVLQISLYALALGAGAVAAAQSQRDTLWYVALFSALVAPAWLLAWRARDALALAIAYLAAITVGLVLLVERLPPNWLLAAAGMLLLASSAAVYHVTRVWRLRPHAAAHVTCRAQTDPAPEPSTPWWLSALMAVAAWTSALLCVAAFFILFQRTEPAVATLLGIIAIACGLLMMQSTHAIRGSFIRQIGFACSLSGQLCLCVTVLLQSHPGEELLLAFACIALLCALLGGMFAHRLLCLVTAILLALVWLVLQGAALLPLALCMTLATLVLWLRVPHPAAWAKALQHAMTLCSLLATGLVAIGETPFDSPVTFAVSPQLAAVLHALTALVWIVTAWLLARPYRPSRWLLGLASAVAATLSYAMPALLLAHALALVVFARGQRVWLALTTLAQVGIVALYYYNMHLSLRTRAVSMLLVGGIAVGVAALLARRHRSPEAGA
nr:DUF2157 domain-containing protein [Lampropedia cohaerens]